MSESRALAVRQMDLQETMTLGKVLAQSGFFSDTKETSQAVVKVLAGAELGFGPIASMTGVHIVQGKPVLGANLMAAAIKGSHAYNYRVVELTEDHAEIAFFENGKEVGRSRFTMQDAQAASLTDKSVWKQYPKNMLFARALSNGARWYCPDVFSGVTPYTPEEMGAEVDGDGDIIDVQPTPAPPQRKPAPPAPPARPAAKATNGRPLTAEQVRTAIHRKAEYVEGVRNVGGEPITEKQIGFVASLLQQAVTPDGSEIPASEIETRRHAVLAYLTGVESVKKLTKREASAIIDWLTVPDGVALNEYAQREAASCFAAWQIEQGQETLPL